jgi:hypothetical protein
LTLKTQYTPIFFTISKNFKDSILCPFVDCVGSTESPCGVRSEVILEPDIHKCQKTVSQAAVVNCKHIHLLAVIWLNVWICGRETEKERVEGTGQVINSYKWRQWERLANSQARKLIPFHSLNRGLWVRDWNLAASRLDGKLLGDAVSWLLAVACSATNPNAQVLTYTDVHPVTANLTHFNLLIVSFNIYYSKPRSQWPRGLRRRSAAA